MPEKHLAERQPSPFALMTGWLRQGTETFFASQRVLLELVMRQNAGAISAFQERLTEVRNVTGTAAAEVAGEGISNLIAAQRVLLNLAQRQNEIVTTAVKERVGGLAPAAAVTELISRGIDTVIGMQQHFLTLAARQADQWIDATKAGEPFEGIHLTELARDSMENFVRSQKKFLDVLAEETAHAIGNGHNGKESAAKTELVELARQSAEAYVDAQKKLLDVAAQQFRVNAKTARDVVDAVNPLSGETLNQWSKHAVENLMETQKSMMDLMFRSPAKTNGAPPPKKAAHKRPAVRRAKPVAEPVEA